MTIRWTGLALSLTLVLASVPVAAQEDEISRAEVPQTIIDALGMAPEEIADLDPNPAWDGLGLFSEDALKIIEAATVDRESITYAFGDDPNGTPLFVPEGATPIGGGAMYWHLPEGWTPPAEGWGDDMAFAQTSGSRVDPEEPFLLLWMEMDSDYDFSSTRQVNEGFPLAVPGLPVWNSTFAGDTWEGANVIPNAVYDGGVLTLDVKMFEPPQGFPLIDLAAFYYRSGNIMAMGVSADDLAALASSAGDVAASDEGLNSNLLYTGGSADTAVDLDAAVDEVLSEIYWFGWSHVTENGQYTPGFISYMIGMFGPLDTFVALAAGLATFGPPPTVPPPEPTAGQSPEPTSAPSSSPTEPPTDTAAEQPLVEPSPVAVDTGNGGGVSGLAVILILVGIVLLGLGLWFGGFGTRSRGGDDEDEEDEDDPDDDDPRDTPPPQIYGEEPYPEPCDWGIVFVGANGPQRVKTPEVRSIGDYHVRISTEELNRPEVKDREYSEQQERSVGYLASMLSLGIWEMYYQFRRKERAYGGVNSVSKRVGTEHEDQPITSMSSILSGRRTQNTSFFKADGIAVRPDRPSAVRMTSATNTIEMTTVNIEFVSTDPSCNLAEAHSFNMKGRSRSDVMVQSECQLDSVTSRSDLEKWFGDNLGTDAIQTLEDWGNRLESVKCEAVFGAVAKAGGRVEFNDTSGYDIRESRTDATLTGPAGSAGPSVGGPEITVGSGPVAVAKLGISLTPSTAHNTKIRHEPYGFGEADKDGLETKVEIMIDVEATGDLTPSQTTSEVFTGTRLKSHAEVRHQIVVVASADPSKMGCHCNPPGIELRVGDSLALTRAPDGENLLPGCGNGVDAEIHYPGGVARIGRDNNGWRLQS
jgi:hypothetical protein